MATLPGITASANYLACPGCEPERARKAEWVLLCVACREKQNATLTPERVTAFAASLPQADGDPGEPGECVCFRCGRTDVPKGHAC
jgi:hypothetical protein